MSDVILTFLLIVLSVESSSRKLKIINEYKKITRAKQDNIISILAIKHKEAIKLNAKNLINSGKFEWQKWEILDLN